MALTGAAKEAIYLRSFLHELDIKEDKITIYRENQGAKCLVENPVFHSRTKQSTFAIPSIVTTKSCRETADLVADILTKSFPGPKHDYFMTYMGVT